MIVPRIRKKPRPRPANFIRAKPYPAREHRTMCDRIAALETITVLPSHNRMLESANKPANPSRVSRDGMSGGGKLTSSFAGESAARNICANGSRNSSATGARKKCQPLNPRRRFFGVWSSTAGFNRDVLIRRPPGCDAWNTRRRTG